MGSFPEWTKDEFTLSCDPARVQFDVVHGFLSRAYWSPGVPREVVERAAAGSLVFGIYRGAEQVGYARVVTDSATFAGSQRPCSWRSAGGGPDWGRGSKTKGRHVP